MTYHRITVGLDGSPGAQKALAWAVREASRRDCTVLAVTAWPDRDRARARQRGDLVADRQALRQMQVAQIAVAVAGLPDPPPVATELVLAEPLTALRHTSAAADLVVLGSDENGNPAAESVAAKLTGQLRRHRRQADGPAVIVV